LGNGTFRWKRFGHWKQKSGAGILNTLVTTGWIGIGIKHDADSYNASLFDLS